MGRDVSRIGGFAAKPLLHAKTIPSPTQAKRNPCKAKQSTLAPCKNTTVLSRCYLNTKMYDGSSTYLTSTCITRGSVSGRITRNIQRLNIPLFKTATGQKTFYYRSVSTWNKLDSSLELCKNPASFTFWMNFLIIIDINLILKINNSHCIYFNFVILFVHWKAPDGDVFNKCVYVFTTCS